MMTSVCGGGGGGYDGTTTSGPGGTSATGGGGGGGGCTTQPTLTSTIVRHAARVQHLLMGSPLRWSHAHCTLASRSRQPRTGARGAGASSESRGLLQGGLIERGGRGQLAF